jgi:hypothetical protein
MDYALEWTVEVWRLDRRVKAGRRLIERHSYSGKTLEQMEAEVLRLNRAPNRYQLVLKPSYHQVRNCMTGQLVWESVDTPWSCSVASEAYWSS